jgi:hypothetical protein
LKQINKEKKKKDRRPSLRNYDATLGFKEKIAEDPPIPSVSASSFYGQNRAGLPGKPLGAWTLI